MNVFEPIKLSEVEFDRLCSHHELQSPEAEDKLGKKEYGQDYVHSSLQGQDDGVNVAQEVHSEGDLE